MRPLLDTADPSQWSLTAWKQSEAQRAEKLASRRLRSKVYEHVCQFSPELPIDLIAIRAGSFRTICLGLWLELFTRIDKVSLFLGKPSLLTDSLVPRYHPCEMIGTSPHVKNVIPANMTRLLFHRHVQKHGIHRNQLIVTIVVFIRRRHVRLL